MSKEGKDKGLPEENIRLEEVKDESLKEETAAVENTVVLKSDVSLITEEKPQVKAGAKENQEADADPSNKQINKSTNKHTKAKTKVKVKVKVKAEAKAKAKENQEADADPSNKQLNESTDKQVQAKPNAEAKENQEADADPADKQINESADKQAKAKPKAKTKKTPAKAEAATESKTGVKKKTKSKPDKEEKGEEAKKEVSKEDVDVEETPVVDEKAKEGGSAKEEDVKKVVEEKDFSSFTKEQIVDEFSEILKMEDVKEVERLVKLIKPNYEKLYESEKTTALEKYISEGGEKSSFEYTNDILDNRYEASYEKYRSRRGAFYADLEAQKDINLNKKHEVIENLRQLVESEETTASIGDLKKLQQEWRTIGPVPNQHVKSLWASFNILIDRFYDNRSIYFELKELDRKKNLNSKIELCQKAEALVEYNNIGDAIKELNELHEEFKHIGPVPKEQQEEIWIRFKAASDSVYSRRKEFMVDLKKELQTNYEDKKKLVEEIQTFRDFDSDKISDWNDKTKELLDIQKKWEKIGGLPREHAKEINKGFWSGFKEFFNNKNRFFKKLESKRDDNLKLKQELVERAQELRESEDWENTASKLKDLQTEWKDIGPVPEKMRNEVFKQFKDACDEFFNRRRKRLKNVEDEYKVNLEKKEQICEEIEKMIENGEPDPEKFQTLQSEFLQLGFVPRNAIKKIQKRYTTVVNKFLAEADFSDEQKNELRFSAEVNRLKSSPNSEKRIQRKENDIRRQISKIENDLAIWKNNLEFFASSKTADKVRAEFDRKINSAAKQLDELKEELKVLSKI